MNNISDQLRKAFEYFDQGYFRQAEMLYLKCIDQIDDTASIAFKQAVHGLGFVKSELGQYEAASDLYLTLLKLSVDEQDREAEAIAYHQLGMVERMAGQTEKASHYFEEELAILHAHFPQWELGYSANYYEQGMLYMQQQQWEKAYRMMMEALHYANKSLDQVAIGCAYRGLGDACRQTNRSKEALQHYQDARAVFRSVQDTRAISELDERIALL